ncbi:Hypothetical_protein [Hexamita inflata]|uniref:Hypothetical_protein n=1 Tax=Hexamita inflata TaxID=28002 RepID=A0AA86TPI4_9EUKA|nr:Hypothetical protein HINF_LOCUS12449 [Hexamita inflata]
MFSNCSACCMLISQSLLTFSMIQSYIVVFFALNIKLYYLCIFHIFSTHTCPSALCPLALQYILPLTHSSFIYPPLSFCSILSRRILSLENCISKNKQKDQRSHLFLLTHALPLSKYKHPAPQMRSDIALSFYTELAINYENEKRTEELRKMHPKRIVNEQPNEMLHSMDRTHVQQKKFRRDLQNQVNQKYVEQKQQLKQEVFQQIHNQRELLQQQAYIQRKQRQQKIHTEQSNTFALKLQKLEENRQRLINQKNKIDEDAKQRRQLLEQQKTEQEQNYFDAQLQQIVKKHPIPKYSQMRTIQSKREEQWKYEPEISYKIKNE